jgi:hypothetical protein
MIKIFIYNLIKYPFILIFLKTPLLNLLKNRFTYESAYKKNIISRCLQKLFQDEYFNRLTNKKEIRWITENALSEGRGRKWAEYYYNQHFKNLCTLKKKKCGLLMANEATPIFEKIIHFIKKNNLEKNNDLYIIQLGSCSGRDLEFFYNLFPKLNYISTDINDEILKFQKKKYKYKNFYFAKCYAEDIDQIIDKLNIYKKNLILFACGSLQYVSPLFLVEFFQKIGKYKNLNLFLNEPVSLTFFERNKYFFHRKKILSTNRGNISFTHNYYQYNKKYNKKSKVIEKKIIKPYAKDDPSHKDTGHYYMHINNNFLEIQHSQKI